MKPLNHIQQIEPAAGIVAESPKRAGRGGAGLGADSPAAAQRKREHIATQDFITTTKYYRHV